MPAPHAFYSKMLAERTASRNVFVLFYLFILKPTLFKTSYHPNLLPLDGIPKPCAIRILRIRAVVVWNPCHARLFEQRSTVVMIFNTVTSTSSPHAIINHYARSHANRWALTPPGIREAWCAACAFLHYMV